MTQCRFRGLQGTYKPRSGVSLGKGSHKGQKRLVGAVIHSVQESKRTYGFCTAWGCLTCPRPRGVFDVSVSSGVRLLVRQQAGGCCLLRAGAQKKTLYPPALPVPFGGLPTIFPLISQGFVNLPFERNDLWHTR